MADAEKLARWNQVNRHLAAIQTEWGNIRVEPGEGEEPYQVIGTKRDGSPADVPNIAEIAPELDESLRQIILRGYRIESNTPESRLRATLFDREGNEVASSNLQFWAFSEIVTYFDEQSSVKTAEG